jgi:hypothetical protein
MSWLRRFGQSFIRGACGVMVLKNFTSERTLTVRVTG